MPTARYRHAMTTTVLLRPFGSLTPSLVVGFIPGSHRRRGATSASRVHCAHSNNNGWCFGEQPRPWGVAWLRNPWIVPGQPPDLEDGLESGAMPP